MSFFCEICYSTCPVVRFVTQHVLLWDLLFNMSFCCEMCYSTCPSVVKCVTQHVLLLWDVLLNMSFCCEMCYSTCPSVVRCVTQHVLLLGDVLFNMSFCCEICYLTCSSVVKCTTQHVLLLWDVLQKDKLSNTFHNRRTCWVTHLTISYDLWWNLWVSSVTCDISHINPKLYYVVLLSAYTIYELDLRRIRILRARKKRHGMIINVRKNDRNYCPRNL